jgi:lysophospholipase L1-like esterase
MFFARWASWLATTRGASHQTLINTCRDIDPDLSWIQSMASIGDSYSAGLGSGKRVHFSCSRYDTAYPTIVRNFLKTASRLNVTHQSLACSGADTTEILTKQVPVLDTNLNLITMSAGGNDIGLTPILSDCVYQFYMADEDACQKSIAEAHAKIANDTQLYRNVTNLIEAVRPHLNETHGQMYVTGYARFFGTDDTTCDNVTWAVWRTLERRKQYLTLSMREALNDMVLSVNAELSKPQDQTSTSSTTTPTLRFCVADTARQASTSRTQIAPG